jgi:outer membrane protein assembly factor BamB
MIGLGGMLHCFDAAKGDVLWKHDCMKEFWGVEKDKDGDDAWFPSCGSAAAPLVDGNQIIVPVGGKKAGAFTAFDRNSGAIVWKALGERSSYASPVFATIAGSRQLVSFSGLRMVGLDAATHKLLWEYPFPARFEQTVVSPIVWKDHVVIAGEDKPTIALRLEKSDGQWKQSVAWESKDLRGYLSTPVVVKDHLIGHDHRLRKLVCVELASGKTKWAAGKFGKYLSLVVAGDHLLVLDDSGQLLVLEADVEKYRVVRDWQTSEPGQTWSHLAVAGKRLYVKDREHLICFEIK